MKYCLHIEISCPDVPQLEDIKETLDVTFETDNKLDGIKQVLIAAGQGWEEFQKSAQK